MDHTLKVYAGTLYDQSRHESAQALSKQRADYLLLISTRKASTLSGPEIQTIIGLYVKHIERCMEAKLASHRRAFDEAGAAPSDEDLREILQDVNDAQRLEINQSLHVLQTFLRPRSGASPGLDTDQLTASLSQGSAHGHDRVLREWKVWGARVQLKTTAHGDDRQFMGMAIEEARKSIAEEDGRVHPKVGAVVVKDGQVLSVAHRGESPGSHAEYIALEEKLANRPVAGATVYTTLEPCTTRNHPKIPCAARLIERKVARVVIGMLDPDPRITGRGQRTLRSANIITELFPHDLMEQVEELNREFTRQHENQKVEGLSQRVRLRVTFAQHPRYVQRKTHGAFVYRLGVVNEGPGAAEGVQLTLENVEPMPASFQGGFPHRLGPQIYGADAVQSDYQPSGVKILEGEEEYFAVSQCWRSVDGNLTVVGLDGFEEHGPGLKRHRWTTMQPGERWTLTMRLSATRADAQIHRVELTQQHDGLGFRLLPLDTPNEPD